MADLSMLVTMTPAEVVLQSLPWALFYGLVFASSRLLAPLAFDHCKKLPSKDLSYWAESMVSTVNSFVLTPMALKAISESALLDPETSFYVGTPWTSKCCCAMVGYTVWDFLTILYYRNEWGGFAMYVVHHIGTISAWGLCASTGYAHVVAVPSLLMEATGPFVNGRYFLSTAGLKETTLYMVNGALMFLSFFGIRIVYNWWIYLLRFWSQGALMWALPNTVVVVLFNILYPVNLSLQMIWFYKITTGIIAILSGKKKR
jgi:hypothetical protein